MINLQADIRPTELTGDIRHTALQGRIGYGFTALNIVAVITHENKVIRTHEDKVVIVNIS